MRFTAIEGKNFKTFIKISDLTTKTDFEIYDVVKTVLYRREYKPFTKSFDKFISYSYLLEDYFFPASFWQDVYSQISKFDSTIKLENEEILYSKKIDKNTCYEYIANLNVPEGIDIVSDKYLFQQKSVVEGIYNKRSRIEIATSGGKTFITYLYCKLMFKFINTNKSAKILIVVPSKTLAKQLKGDFADYDKLNPLSEKLQVETIFAGSKSVFDADVVCGTFQSLSNYDREYFDDFFAIIVDELHTASAYSIRNEIESKCLKCEYAFGMTGTMPEYKSLEYLHITSMFGKTVFKLSSKEAIDSGISSPIKIEIIKIDYIDEYKGFSKNLIEKGIIGIEKLNEEKAFFQAYEPRTNLLYKLLKHYTDNTLILVSTVEYCTVLHDFLSEKLGDEWVFSIIHGTINNREDILYDFKNSKDKNCIIATYGCMSTGVSIKNIGNIYFPDGGKSEKRIRQSLGRGMRLFPTKEFCRVFDFQDNMDKSSFKSHAYERTKIYKEQKFPFNITKITI